MMVRTAGVLFLGLSLVLALFATPTMAAGNDVDEAYNFGGVDRATLLNNYFNEGTTNPAHYFIPTEGAGPDGSAALVIGSTTTNIYNIWTAKLPITTGGEGSTYSVEGFFNGAGNDGFGILGFSPADTNASSTTGNANTYGVPPQGIAISFHGGGALVFSDGVTAGTGNGSITWTGGKALGHLWYYVKVLLTETADNTFSLNITVNDVGDGLAIGEELSSTTVTDIPGGTLGAANTIYGLFGTATHRFIALDNFAI